MEPSAPGNQSKDADNIVQYTGHPHLGRRLRELRERAELSLRDLERLTGYGRTWLGKLEASPTPNPTLGVLLALQEAFELDSLEALLGELPSVQRRNEYRHGSEPQEAS